MDRRLTLLLLWEMFAMRFLRTRGPPKALQKLLGLAEKQYLERLWRCLEVVALCSEPSANVMG